ncbi:MAG: hypothetical protein R3314_02940 [Longimicrobiales bacterium]|nr:hypothetical protein [Longimicrobiales bacterium]
MRIRRVVALARFDVSHGLRSPYAWVGGALLILLTVLGVVASARAGRGIAVDAGFVFDGALLAAVFGVRSGRVARRTSGLRPYLSGFVTPVEEAGADILALLTVWGLVCGAVLLLNLPGPGGAGDAAWHATVFAVRTGVLLPFVIVAESVTTIEIPFFLPVLAFVGLLMTLVLTVGEAEAVAALAPPMPRGEWTTAGPVAARTGLVLALGIGVLVLEAWIRTARRRSRGDGPRSRV